MSTPRAERRTWLAVAVFACTLAAMPDGPTFAADEPLAVTLKNRQFEPGVLHARPGQTIRFDNADDALHSLLLVGHENLIGEEFIEPGQSFTARIPQDLAPGTYELACTIHVDMRGQIVVSGE